MDNDDQIEDEALSESKSLEKELLDLRKETNVLMKDITVCRTDQEKLVNEKNQLEKKIRHNTECLKIKYKDRKNIEEIKRKVDHFEEILRSVETNYESRVKELSDKNLDLEESLELMRHEFEEMENYWQKKIEDERTFYDKQIKLEERHFRDLELKILEYDERFSMDRTETLFTIQEDDRLEDEVTILEGELEELRDRIRELTDENQKLQTQIFFEKEKFLRKQMHFDNRQPQSLPCPFIYL